MQVKSTKNTLSVLNTPLYRINRNKLTTTKVRTMWYSLRRIIRADPAEAYLLHVATRNGTEKFVLICECSTDVSQAFIVFLGVIVSDINLTCSVYTKRFHTDITKSGLLMKLWKWELDWRISFDWLKTRLKILLTKLFQIQTIKKIYIHNIGIIKKSYYQQNPENKYLQQKQKYIFEKQ